MNVKKVTALITSFLELTHSVAKEESEKLAKNTGAYSRTKSEKISLEDFIMASVLRCGVTLSDLALNYFGPGTLRPSASAFSQAKRKTPLYIAENLFHKTNKLYKMNLTYKGYRVILVDGSNEPISPNKNEKEYLITKKNADKIIRAGIHVNAIYDALNRKFLKVIFQDQKSKDERKATKAILEWVHENYPNEKFLFIMDRGYFSYSLCLLCEEYGYKYLIRMKERDYEALALKSIECVDDQEIDRTLTWHLRKEERDDPQMKFLARKAMKEIDPLADFIKFSARLVCLEIATGSYEGLITNLNPNDFPSGVVKIIYHLRWGIETSFSWLKYGIGAKRILSNKAEYIKQEILYSLVFYNLCTEIDSLAVEDEKSYIKTGKEKRTRYEYQTNFTKAIRAIRKLLTPQWRSNRTRKPITTWQVANLIEEICREKLPVRNGRTFPRNMHPNRVIPFQYR